MFQGLPAQHPICPTHSPRALAIDLQEGSRGWVCCAGSPPQMLPCMPIRLPVEADPNLHVQIDAPAAEQHMQSGAGTSHMPWYQQGPPPPTAPLPPTHSWFFVPLLHAAARRLAPQAQRAWEADARFSVVWHRYLFLLQSAQPIRPDALVRALAVLQQLAAAGGQPCPPAEARLLDSLVHETSCLPATTLAHFAWAWNLFTLPGGYIPATAQEALLQSFLGAEEASALVQSLAVAPATGAAAAVPPSPGPSSSSSTTSSSANNGSGSSDSSSTSSSPPLSVPNAASPSEQQRPRQQTSPAPADADDMPTSHAPPMPPHSNSLQGRNLREALVSLDACDVRDLLRQPCPTFRTPPAFIKGPLRQALLLALSHIQAASDPLGTDAARAWKLWLLLPRMLLHRPAAAACVAKPELRARFDKFFRGDWLALLQEAEASSTPRPHPVMSRTSTPVHAEPSTLLTSANCPLPAKPCWQAHSRQAMTPHSRNCGTPLGGPQNRTPRLSRRSSTGLRHHQLLWHRTCCSPISVAEGAELHLDPPVTPPRSFASSSMTPQQPSPCTLSRRALRVRSCPSVRHKLLVWGASLPCASLRAV